MEQNKISGLIMNTAMDQYTKKLNISKLGRVLCCSTARLWFYFRNKRKWNTDMWIKTLAALDCLEVKYDKIIIKVKLPDDQIILLNKLYKKDCS